jgi:hypothetical protein
VENKIKVRIKKMKLMDSLYEIDRGHIDIAEYKSKDGSEEYCVRKMEDEIIIYTKNAEMVVITDDLIGYKYMTKEEKEQYVKNK